MFQTILVGGMAAFFGSAAAMFGIAGLCEKLRRPYAWWLLPLALLLFATGGLMIGGFIGALSVPANQEPKMIAGSEEFYLAATESVVCPKSGQWNEWDAALRSGWLERHQGHKPWPKDERCFYS